MIISRASTTQVALSWESTGAFQLESRESLSAGDWNTLQTVPTVDSNRSTVVLPVTGSLQFYRLRSK
ncbi:MAG TPA: hypothetical protein P5186_10780 [Candidatus Paceibacterota bacterium]|nr:hypothetical protein [Verrucomicrobiota bacterium]HRY48522.1 hypothetical protein [Candidatus Paceibacterota bacterium]HSA00532.1 hypothetical protein [Candidatus Paceibacterota bacterium]